MKASSFLALLLLARHSVLGEDQEGGVTSEACNEYAATSNDCAVGEVTTGVNLDYQCTYQGETSASSCMDDYCSGLVFGCNRCTNLGAENRWQTVSASTCTSLFAAGFRVEGEVGCATGSICAKFQIIEGQMSQLFSLNQADVILEIVSALLAVSFIAANYAGMHGTSMLLNRVNVYFLMAMDLILQIAVLIIASSIDQDVLQNVKDANCWDRYSIAVDLINDTLSGLEWIVILGWMELVIVLVALSSAIIDRFKEDEDKDFDRNLVQRLGLVISVLAIFFDVVISSIDFFKFTVESRENFVALSDTLTTVEETDTGNYDGSCNPNFDGGQTDEFGGQAVANYPRKCFQAKEPYKPYPVPLFNVTDDAACVLPSVVKSKMASWVVCVINLMILWAGAVIVESWRRRMNPNLSPLIGGGEAVAMTMTEIRQKLEDTEAEARERKESSDRKDVELREKEAEIERQRAEIERMKKLFAASETSKKGSKGRMSAKEKESSARQLKAKEQEVERLSEQIDSIRSLSDAGGLELQRLSASGGAIV